MADKTCRVPHCEEPTSSRFSPLCRRHKSTHYRQGDPTQTAISTRELKPFRDRVKARMTKNADSPLWDQLDALWEAIAAEARHDTKRTVGSRYQRSAAHELLNIDADSTPCEIVTTTLAMFVLRHDAPYRAVGDWRKHGEGAEELLAPAFMASLGPLMLRAVLDRPSSNPSTGEQSNEPPQPAA